MDNDLARLADLMKRRNALECEITQLIARPMSIGHIGEFIASRIFNIQLEYSASSKGIDGHFSDGMLKGRSVNVKWYAMREGLLDITPDFLPDYYLVLVGPRSPLMSSRGRTRPWTIEGRVPFQCRYADRPIAIPRRETRHCVQRRPFVLGSSRGASEPNERGTGAIT